MIFDSNFAPILVNIVHHARKILRFLRLSSPISTLSAVHCALKGFPTVPAGRGSPSSPDCRARSEGSARVAKFRLPRTLELLLGRLPVHRESMDSVRARTAPQRRCFAAATRAAICTRRRSCSKLGRVPRSFRESAPPTSRHGPDTSPFPNVPLAARFCVWSSSLRSGGRDYLTQQAQAAGSGGIGPREAKRSVCN